MKMTAEVKTGEVEEKPTEEESKKTEEPRKTQVPPQKRASSPEARPPAEEGRPELSVSPEGLMLPEGPRLIQRALTKHGYLPSDSLSGELDKQTSAALRKFQGDEKLAKTGAPDRETVRRLGLSIGQVFRSSRAESAESRR